MTLPQARMPHYRQGLSGEMLLTEMESGDGFATFDCADEEALLQAAREYGVVMAHRDADARGITHLRDTASDPRRETGFTNEALLPHTDRTAVEVPPRVLLLWCSRASADGGDAVVLRGTDVVSRLRELDPAALAALSEADAAIFRTGTEEIISPVFRITDGILREVRLRFDPFVYFSVFAARALPALERALRETEQVFPLIPGTGYALRNDLWLHGRRPFSGDREMCRIMISGKPPSET